MKAYFRVGKRTIAKPEYRAFRNARDRCTVTGNPMYRNYGGRGVQFKFKDFDEFIGDIGERPSKNHSLDRINNDGHYEVGNVRWATKSQQMRNRRPYKWLNPTKPTCHPDLPHMALGMCRKCYWRHRSRVRGPRKKAASVPAVQPIAA